MMTKSSIQKFRQVKPPTPIAKLKNKKIALFVPCYIDQLYPEVGMASYRFLQRYIPHLEVPEGQTCCGQPMMNSGYFKSASQVGCYLSEIFLDYDYIVCPSASCASMVRHHLVDVMGGQQKNNSRDKKQMEKIIQVASRFL